MPQPLIFDADGTFKLAVFTDLHYGERNGDESWSEWGFQQDVSSTRVMNHVLDEESPNLVVFNGDQVTGENLSPSNASSYLSLVFSAAVSHSTPFTSVYGNHDNAPSISHSLLYAYEKEHFGTLSLTQSTPTSAEDQNGRFNYFLEVWGEEVGFGVPEVILWFFDSRSGIFDDPSDYEDWVDPSVVSWINSTSLSLLEKYGALPPSLAFVHIAPSAAKVIQSRTVSPNPVYPGLNDDDPLDPQGQNHPEVTHPDEGFWAALTASLGDGLLAAVVGHDHGNDWCAKADEEPHTVCFARHTGYRGYGSRPRGSRIFKLARRDSGGLGVETWIRLEDHSTANGTTLR